MNKQQLQEQLIKETKYSKWYLNIIENANNQNRKKLNKDHKDYIYYENHHILPKSIYPIYENLRTNEWNGVLLNTREHFLCHLLIWKHYKEIGYTFGEIKMRYSLNAFLGLTKKRLESYGEINIYNFSKIYQYIKNSISCSEEIRKKLSKANKGKKHTEETKKKISKGNLGKGNKKGNKHTEEHKKKISKSLKGTKKPEGFNIGREFSEEHKKKISNAVSGENNGMFGKTPTEELKNKIKNTLINKKRKRINIFNSNNEIKFVCEKGFKRFCKERKLPYTFLYRSLHTDSVVEYKDAGNRKRAEEKGYLKYEGYYAKFGVIS